MDYEKSYKDALERAKKLKETCDSTAVIGWCEYIFPELKEPEDEEMRKELTNYIKKKFENSCSPTPSKNTLANWIAWLEKQGKEKSMKVYRVENEAEQKGLWRKFDGTYQPLFDMLTDGKCKDLPMEDSPIYREGGKQWFASAPSKETLQKWFSKEDLEELVSKGFTISEFEVVGYKKVSDFEYIFTRDNIINRNYLEVSDIYPEQKDFAPKVEPKFKVGDWVVTDKGDTVQIETVNNDYYTIGNGMLFSMSYVDTSWHLWTIEDAKDGDVLANDWYQGNDSWEKIIIFKKYHNKGIEGLINAPCVEGYGNTYKNRKMAFDEEVPYFSKTWTDNLRPATKEQRDLLFARMKEEGCVWYEDKKEPIKL